MRAHVIYARNPLAPMLREIVTLSRPRRIRALAPAKGPAVAVLNGRPILRAGWRRRLRDGDHLVFAVLPRGGGGGNGGSNPMAALMSIALFALAPWAAGAITGIAAGAVGAQGLILAGTKLAIQLAGSALINAVFPAPKSGTGPTPSPTYSLQAQGNVARVEQPIPVQYGRVLSYPDFAALPYVEYAGQEQYLYHLLCLGAGEYDVEQIRIEDTPISSFEEITYEVVPPGGQVTLFPTAVVTSSEVSGQELLGKQTGTWTRSGTTATITQTAHGYAAGQAKYVNFTSGGATSGVYAIATVPTADTFTVTVPAVGTSGNCDIHSVVGGVDGFLASGPATVAQRIGVDFVLPTGLFTRSGGSLQELDAEFRLEAQPVDDLGLPTGSWVALEASGLITGRSVTPQRFSFTYALGAPGRYRLRAWRINAKSAVTDSGDQLLWAGLRAYLSEPEDRGPVTLIAMRMRATNNLSLQASRKVGVIATRKLPVWNGTSWSAPVATTSIAWALADAARNTTYGARQADAGLDLASLLALDAVWAARGDTFNHRFDSATSWWEAARQILAAGRAQPFLQGGILRVVRDGPQTVPVALFSMRNIKAGSFSIDYLPKSSETADAVTATYWDNTTWAPQRVTGKVAGSTAAQPAKMTLVGVDNRGQALREATYHAASNKYRRRVVRFETEMEGFIPAFGDLIAVQHDMVGWGQHAEAIGWDAASRILTLSEPVTVGAASVVGLRRDDGGLSGPWQVIAGPTSTQVMLAVAPDITPHVTGQMRERTHVLFGTASTWATLAKVASVRPRGLYEVEIEAVPDDPSVHTAEIGITAPPIRTSQLARVLTQPRVTGLFARKIPGETDKAVFGWQPAPGAELYHLEMAEGSDVSDPATGWTRIGDTPHSQRVALLMFSNRTMVRVRAVGLAAGPWTAATIGTLIPQMWNTDATAMWTSDPNLMWSA